MSFVDVLTKKGIINQYQVADLSQKAQELGSIDDAFVALGIDEEILLDIKSEYFNLPKRHVPQLSSFDILKYVPEDSARHYKFVPIGISNDVLEIGLLDPENIEAYNAIQFVAAKNNLQVKTFVITNSDFKKISEGYSSVNNEVNEVAGNLAESTKDADFSASLENVKNEKKIVEDAPVTKMVAVILRHAAEGRASDIHIESNGKQVKVRFRVDGILHTSLLLQLSTHSALVARIKILAKLKLDEKRKPQDGRFPAKIDGRKIDFRVSTFPTFYGEKVVIRILDSERGVKVLEKTGMLQHHVDMVREAIKRPYGLILITGPTGSGKTTTLYSMLREIDREKMNVVSLEDPIEYSIDGMNQSQVNPEIGYTFANGLRSILRQDPDVIMVGEIRDKETAHLAIQAALTGHLVFSTLHTNTSIGVIPRLIDMGVDPYLIAPTLVLAIAQRLVRKMCDGAQKPLAIDKSVRMMFEQQFADLPASVRNGIDLNAPVYEAQSTPECPLGVRGRLAVYEMFKMDKKLESVILNEPSEPEIYKVARSQGMMTMKEDAILKSMAGQISFNEINLFN